MKLRAQLLLAFVLLAVLPLTAIVLYSYVTSIRAFRRAVEVDTQALTEEMRGQLDSVRQDLDRRFRALERLPFGVLRGTQPTGEEASEVYSELMTQIGDAAPLVESFEFIPAAPAPPAPPAIEAEAWGASPGREEQGAGEGQPGGFVIYPSETLAEALRKLERHRDSVSDEYIEATIREAIRAQGGLGRAELEAIKAREEQTRLLLGTEFRSDVRRGEKLIGYLTARVRAPHLLRRILGRGQHQEGDIAYAVDAEGHLYVADANHEALLADLHLPVTRDAVGASRTQDDWIVAELTDPDSGLTLGTARPVRESLRQIRATAVRNFGYGLAVVFFALLGILWLSGRLTRNLTALAEGAERLARGELEVNVPVRSLDELGQLARTFNRMARDLRQKHDQLLKKEVEQRLLQAENDRKGRELEEARQFQLSLLPKALPRHPEIEVAVFMETATEVGGDYYDFVQGEDGALTAAIGDATGHGAKAGTMVMAIKGLFIADGGRSELPRFLEGASRAIRRMDLGRMNMALAVARIQDGKMFLSAAGMPPALLYRQERNEVEEVALPGMPLGAPLGEAAGLPYGHWQCDLVPGDAVLLMTDGFPELLDGGGEPLGYSRVRSLFEASAARSPQQIIADLSAAVSAWNGGVPPDDDITFVALKIKEPGDRP